MKALKFLLTAAATALIATGAATAEEQPKLVGVNALAGQPANYSDKLVALTAIIERASAERKMLTLIDTSEAGCTDTCSRSTVIARLGQDAALPKAQEPVIVIGRLETTTAPLRFAVAEIVSGKEAVETRAKTLSGQ